MKTQRNQKGDIVFAGLAAILAVHLLLAGVAMIGTSMLAGRESASPECPQAEVAAERPAAACH